MAAADLNAKEESKIANADDLDNDEEELSGAEEAEEEAVMRSEIAVAIKDTALPTAEEVQEFEKFSSRCPNIE